MAARQPRLRVHAAPGQFSFLTGIYEKTPPALFRETAAAVFSQSSPEFEWILLAHGPIPEELETVLVDVAADHRVRLIRLETNRGIIGGMRVCLEAARGDYVIPLDADDMLFPDALQVCAQALSDHDSPAFLYTDEDHLARGVARSPFRRPDWDPVLNQSGSYIWHLCAFDRQVALHLGIYTDNGSNWCHDWDSVFRFARGGHPPLHVPEIVYHWRTHPGSHTNRRKPHPGSLQSQQHVLEEHIARQPRPELYEVRPFPLNRGSAEWWIARKPIEPPTIDLIQLNNSAAEQPGEILNNCRFQFNNLRTVKPSQLLREASAADYVAVIAAGLQPHGDQWLWEAIGLFELHPDLALIAGRIANENGTVIGGGGVIDESGFEACPETCADIDDPGPFSLWLKPRSVSTVNPHFFLVRAEFLNETLDELPAEIDFHNYGRHLGNRAAAQGQRTATSPLILATTSQTNLPFT